MFKKTLVFVLILICAGALASCGKKAAKPATSGDAAEVAGYESSTTHAMK